VGQAIVFCGLFSRESIRADDGERSSAPQVEPSGSPGQPAKKKCPGFTARLSEPPACSALDRQPDTPDSTLAARRRRFSACAGSVQRTFPQRTCIRPEPETRNGLSLARNDAFATITRSTFLACPFDSTYKLCADPFHRRLSARLGFEAATGRIHRPRPVICALPIRSRDAAPSPLPFGLFCPPDQSVQRTTSQEARLAEHPICLLLPAALSFDCASDQCSKLRFVPLGYRSVNPGTESMMHPAPWSGQWKNRGFPQLLRAVFSAGYSRVRWILCA
jgi:hypothetical protein